MRKLIILFLVLVLFCGCESQLDKNIPQSSLIDAISNIDINLDGEGEWATRRSCVNKHGWCWESKDWTIINVDGFVPYDIKREQVKPSLLAVFKRVKKEYPQGNVININLAPDKEMAEMLFLVGRLEYKDNKIIIRYGIPSDKEMEDHNSQIGKLYPPNKNCPGIFCDHDSTMKVNNDVRLFRPDQKTYISYKNILMIEDDIKLQDRGIPKKYFNSMKEYYDDLSNKIRKRIDLPNKDIEYALRFMHSYYGWMGFGKDEESINIQL